MGNKPDWNEIHDHLEQLLPTGLNETTWEALHQHSLPFVADELLWRVEAIVGQVPAQGMIFLQPIVRESHTLVVGQCALCAEQPGSGVGHRCARCVAALNLVLGFPLSLDDAGLIDAGEVATPNEQDERGASGLFEL